jgi:predicted GIY-YIG superfamily endonuclease
MTMSFLYWLYDDTCNDILTDGYVGVTEDINIRINGHKRKTQNLKDKDLKVKIVYEGDRATCFDKERELRPNPGIGWNRAIGGSHGWREGFIHSKETKEKMSKKWTKQRKDSLVQRNKKQGKKRKGALPEQLYVMGKCTHCSMEATQSNITKWHDDHCNMNPNNLQNEIGLFEYIECPYCSFRPNTSKANSRRNFKVYHLDNCKMLKELMN